MAKEKKSEVASVLTKQKSKEKEVKKFTFVFNKEKYRIMLIGIALIIVGFLLMIGGGSKDPNVFSTDLFSFRRMTLAPILVLAGYVVEIYAIMKKPKAEVENELTKTE